MTNRKLIPVFDLGGVLIDWNPHYLYEKLIPDEAERHWFLREVCPPEWNLEQDRGRNWAEAVAEACQRHPDQAARIEAYHTRWIEMIRGRIPDMLEIKNALQQAGYDLYSITNFSHEKLLWATKIWPELTDFKGQAVSGQLGLIKPDARIYRWLCETYALDPADCLFIDDVAENVVAAEKIGMRGHHFRDAAILRQNLHHLGCLP